MINYLKVFLLALLTVFVISIEKAHAQNIIDEYLQAVDKPHANSKLLADRVKMDHERLLIDSVLMQIGLESEEDNPADELYDGQWNNEYVKAYANVVVPESFQIDVSDFVMPFDGKVTSKFGHRRRRFHYGTDIKLQVGDTVRAAFEGKVRIKSYQRRGYGNYVVLRHPNGLETVYGHLSGFLVEEGTSVQAGEPIALGGNTGRSTGSHLHFEMRFLGNAINPEEIIDFEQFCTKDEFYVFEKGKSDRSSTSSSTKYAASGKGKIKYYRIKYGDNLGRIAQRTGVPVNRICRLNNIKPTTTLRIGKTLRLS
jgi:murein DD-endopeptidase MepM/ murein hydrolase activator NlpD